MAAEYRWDGFGAHVSRKARRQQRRDEARQRNSVAAAGRRPTCGHVHGQHSEYARTVCGVR